MSSVDNLAAARAQKPRRKRRNDPLTRLWRRVRAPLAESSAVKGAIAGFIAGALRFVRWSSRPAPDAVTLTDYLEAYEGSIFALWHGQHILAPVFNPPTHDIVAMFSRSADAELNALVAEKLGFRTVRGSGGRQREKSVEKGGARALIALKKALDAGTSVAMIADIPHGTPREAGLGVITLARISGRPIVGIAIASSRRKVLEKSWDKTTINLPFSRLGISLTEPLHVPADADAATQEELRAELTARMNAATDEAYRQADGRP